MIIGCNKQGLDEQAKQQRSGLLFLGERHLRQDGRLDHVFGFIIQHHYGSSFLDDNGS
jgi:hypothetical protein